LNWKILTIGSTAALALVTIVLFSLFASGAIVTSTTIASSGTVTSISATPGLGVYSNSAGTTVASAIDWGTISPGGSVTRTVYVKNTGTTTFTLGMSTSNWSPSAANGPITISWDQAGTTLAPGQIATATLTLRVSSTISGVTTFSNSIIISGNA
jgi:hypothetical protein